MSDLITSTALKELVAANMVRSAFVIGEPGGFSVMIKYGMTERVIGARSKTNTVHKRTFPSLDSVDNFLRKTVHIVDYSVNSANFEAPTLKPKSLKVQARMKLVHQTAAHTDWLRKEVEASRADTRPVVSNEDARKFLDANLAKLSIESKAPARKKSAVP